MSSPFSTFLMFSVTSVNIYDYHLFIQLYVMLFYHRWMSFVPKGLMEMSRTNSVRKNGVKWDEVLITPFGVSYYAYIKFGRSVLVSYVGAKYLGASSYSLYITMSHNKILMKQTIHLHFLLLCSTFHLCVNPIIMIWFIRMIM